MSAQVRIEFLPDFVQFQKQAQKQLKTLEKQHRRTFDTSHAQNGYRKLTADAKAATKSQRDQAKQVQLAYSAALRNGKLATGEMGKLRKQYAAVAKEVRERAALDKKILQLQKGQTKETQSATRWYRNLNKEAKEATLEVERMRLAGKENTKEFRQQVKLADQLGKKVSNVKAAYTKAGHGILPVAPQGGIKRTAKDFATFLPGQAGMAAGYASGGGIGGLSGGATAGVLAGGAALAGVIKTGVDFESELTKSLAIQGEVSEQMRERFKETARAVSKDYNLALDQSAQSYFYLTSAGLSAEQQLAALPQVAQFAKAGMFDMALATDLATDAQSALGLTVDDPVQNLQNLTRVTDVVTKANTLANATIQQFSTSLTTKSAAAMKTYGIAVEEGTAVLAAFADQGTKGEKAGTAYEIVYRNLSKAAIDNADAFKQLNIEVFNADGTFRNAADILEDFEEAMDGANAKQKKMMLSELGLQERSQQYLLQLVGTSDQVREYQTALEGAAGTTEEVAEKQMESVAEKWKGFMIQVQDLALTLFDALQPALFAVMDILSGVMSVLGPLVKLIGELIAGIVDGIKWIGEFTGITTLLREGLDLLSGATKGATAEFDEFGNVTKTYEENASGAEKAMNSIEEALYGIETNARDGSKQMNILAAIKLLNPVEWTLKLFRAMKKLTIDGIGGLLMKIPFVNKWVNRFKDSVAGAWRWVKNAASAVSQWARELPLLGGPIQTIANKIDWLIRKVRGAIGWLKKITTIDLPFGLGGAKKPKPTGGISGLWEAMIRVSRSRDGKAEDEDEDTDTDTDTGGGGGGGSGVSAADKAAQEAEQAYQRELRALKRQGNEARAILENQRVRAQMDEAIYNSTRFEMEQAYRRRELRLARQYGQDTADLESELSIASMERDAELVEAKLREAEEQRERRKAEAEEFLGWLDTFGARVDDALSAGISGALEKTKKQEEERQTEEERKIQQFGEVTKWLGEMTSATYGLLTAEAKLDSARQTYYDNQRDRIREQRDEQLALARSREERMAIEERAAQRTSEVSRRESAERRKIAKEEKLEFIKQKAFEAALWVSTEAIKTSEVYKAVVKRLAAYADEALGALQSAASSIASAVAAMISSAIKTLGWWALPVAAAGVGGIFALWQSAKSLLGFEEGGFTGKGRSDEPAGIVHRNEFVLPQGTFDLQSDGSISIGERSVGGRQQRGKDLLYDPETGAITVAIVEDGKVSGEVDDRLMPFATSGGGARADDRNIVGTADTGDIMFPYLVKTGQQTDAMLRELQGIRSNLPFVLDNEGRRLTRGRYARERNYSVLR